MEYLIVISIILIYSGILTIILKKKIEQTIPISVVGICLVIYLAGMFDNLKIGPIIVGIMAIVGIAIILYVLLKEKESGKVKEILSRIITPGAIVYIILCVLFIFINKERICEDYDEFNHWARITKNMFMYNTYGVNKESIVVFNEYPPFTAIFQYIFLAIKSVYSEDVIITAQCILYLSIIIPITKNIKWNKTLANLIVLIPSIIFIPILFYENFYLDILVDGIIGIMFASLIYTFYNERDIKYKYIKVFSLLIMITLTKTSGIALSVLALLIFIIKLIKDRKTNVNIKKEIKNIVIVIILVTILTGIWYIKTSHSVKRWNFEQYVETDNKTVEEQLQVAKSFINAVMFREIITNKNTTVFIIFLILIITNFYLLKKAKEKNNKNYKYYSIAMLISIPIYMLFLLITYATIFDMEEAQYLTCFERYTSTIILANVIFQLLALADLEEQINVKKVVIMFTIIISLLPYENINKKYIDGKKYIQVASINRSIYTKLKLHINKIKKDSKVLLIVGERSRMEYLQSLNEYESNIKIANTVVGDFKKEENLKQIVKDYDYVFIYRMESETKEIVQNLFKNNYVKNDTLYKVNNNQEQILERVGINYEK